MFLSVESMTLWVGGKQGIRMGEGGSKALNVDEWWQL